MASATSFNANQFPVGYNLNPVCASEPTRILNATMDMMFLEGSTIRQVSLALMVIGYLHCLTSIIVFFLMHKKYSRIKVRSRKTTFLCSFAVMFGMISLTLNNVVRLQCALRILPNMFFPTFIVVATAVRLVSLYYKANLTRMLHDEVHKALGLRHISSNTQSSDLGAANLNEKKLALVSSYNNSIIGKSSARRSELSVGSASIIDSPEPEIEGQGKKLSLFATSASDYGFSLPEKRSSEIHNSSLAATTVTVGGDHNSLDLIRSWKWNDTLGRKITVAFVTPIILLVIVNASIDEALRVENHCYGCFYTIFQLLIIGISCFIIIFFSYYVSRRIPDEGDAFGIFAEMRLSSLFGSLALIGTGLGAMTTDGIELGKHFSASYIVWFALQGYIFSTITLQLIKANKEGSIQQTQQQQQHQSKVSRMIVMDDVEKNVNQFDSLKEILLSKTLVSHPFYKFCQSRYCIEGVEFYVSCHIWMNTFHSNESNARRIKAKKISNIFLARDAPCEVNLPYDMITEIIQKIDDKSTPLKIDLFDIALEECMNVIHGTYLDFVNVSSFTQI